MSYPVFSTRKYEIQADDDNHGVHPAANSSPSPQGQVANTTPAVKDLPLPAIIGGGVAGLILIGIVILCIYIWYRKKYPVRMVLGKDFQRFSNPAYKTKKMSELKLIVEDPLAAYDVPLEQVNEGFIPDDEKWNETVPDDADAQIVHTMKANGGNDNETADEYDNGQNESDHIKPVPPIRKTKQAMLVRSEESETVEVINEFELESKDVVEDRLNNKPVESSDLKSSTAETNDEGSAEIVPQSSTENVNKQSIENKLEENIDSSFTTRTDSSDVSGGVLEGEHNTDDKQDYIRCADKDSDSEKSSSNSNDNISPEGKIGELSVRDTSVDLSLERVVESNTLGSNNTLVLSASSVDTVKDTNAYVEHSNEEEQQYEIKHENNHSNKGEISTDIKNEIQNDTISCKSVDTVKNTNAYVEQSNEAEQQHEIKHENTHSNKGEMSSDIKNEIQNDTTPCKYVDTVNDTNAYVEQSNEEEQQHEIKHENNHSNKGEMSTDIKNEIQNYTTSCKSGDSKVVPGELFDNECNNSVDNLDGEENVELLASNPEAFQNIQKVIDIESEDVIDGTALSPSLVVTRSDELIVDEQASDIVPVNDIGRNSRGDSPISELISSKADISDTVGTSESNTTDLSDDLHFHSNENVADNSMDKRDDDTKNFSPGKCDDNVDIDSGQFKALDCQSMQGNVLKLDIDSAVLTQDFTGKTFTAQNRRVLSTDNIVIECSPPTPVIVQDAIILEPDISHMDNRYSSVPDIRGQRSFTFNLDQNSSNNDRPRHRWSFDNHRNLTETLSDSFQSLIANKSKDSQEMSSVLQEDLAFNGAINGSLVGIEFEKAAAEDLTQITADLNLEYIEINDTRDTVGHSEDILTHLSQSEKLKNGNTEKEIKYSINEDFARRIHVNSDIPDVSSLKNTVETNQSMDTFNSFEVISTSTESVSTIDKALILTSEIPESCSESRISGEIEQNSDSDVSTHSACSKSWNLVSDSTKDTIEPNEVPTFPISIEQSAARTTDSAHLLKIDASGFTFDDESENDSSTSDESIDGDDDSLEVFEEDESNA